MSESLNSTGKLQEVITLFEKNIMSHFKPKEIKQNENKK